MALDTVGDILSMFLNQFGLILCCTIDTAAVLAIPLSIIWRIRVPLSQKMILGCSLCLTIVMIALSIIRVSGLVHVNAIDSIWSTYWQFLGFEIGVFLASAVAFRSFFTARNQSSRPVQFSIKRALKQSLSGSNRL